MSNLMFFSSSPLEQFEVVSLLMFSAPIFDGQVLALTNLGLYCVIGLSLVVSLNIVANNQYRLVPSRWSIFLESLYASLAGMVRDQIGPQYEKYTPLIYSLFVYILAINLNGNIPYGYTVTTSGVAALGLSVYVFIAVTLLGLFKHRVRFFSYYLPNGTPTLLIPLLTLIETVSYFARSVSLGVRLFSNMTAGHTLLKILATFLAKLFMSGIKVAAITLVPFAVFVGLIGLEMAVSLIQSYVFCILVCSYLKDAIALH